jgi:hypothetical protein
MARALIMCVGEQIVVGDECLIFYVSVCERFDVQSNLSLVPAPSTSSTARHTVTVTAVPTPQTRTQC